MNGWLKKDQTPSEDRFGFLKLRELFKIVTEELGQEPVVVDAHQFRNDPETVLRAYCERIGIEFYPEMLSWERKEHHTWEKELMKGEEWSKWQETLNTSTGILPAAKEKIEIPAQYNYLLEPAMEVYEELSAYCI